MWQTESEKRKVEARNKWLLSSAVQEWQKGCRFKLRQSTGDNYESNQHRWSQLYWLTQSQTRGKNINLLFLAVQIQFKAKCQLTAQNINTHPLCVWSLSVWQEASWFPPDFLISAPFSLHRIKHTCNCSALLKLKVMHILPISVFVSNVSQNQYIFMAVLFSVA